MDFLFLLVATFILSAIGILPPGMINMTVASYSAKKSLKKAKLFINGAVVVVFIQSFIGFLLGKLVGNNDAIVNNIKLVGSVVFVILTIFFFGKGIQNYIQNKNQLPKNNVRLKLKPFQNGVVISALNVFPIPYYSFVSLFLAEFISDFFSVFNAFFFCIAATLGTYTIFYSYAILFRKYKQKVQFITKNVNFFIAFITALIAVFTIYNFK